MDVGRGTAGTQVRLPEDLKLWLKHRAVDNRRSLNSEIIVLLEDSRRREQEAHDAQK